MKAYCTICCDLFDDKVSVAATPCGHTFHELCLLQWLEHARTCPTCRKHVSHNNVIRLYFTVNTDQQPNLDQVQNELENVKAELKVKQLEQLKMKAVADELRSCVVTAELRLQDAKDELVEVRSQACGLKKTIKTLTKEVASMENVNNENSKLRQQLLHFKSAEAIINGCEKDIKQILEQYADSPASKKQMATYCALLKMELQKAGDGKRKLQEEMKTLKKELGHKAFLANDALDRMRKADSEVQFLKECLSNGISPSRSPNISNKRQMSDLNAASPLQLSSQQNVKRPKINILSPTACIITKRNVVANDLTAGVNFFTAQTGSCENSSDSTISVGYDGMGGHGKHIVRTTKPLLRLKNRKNACVKENRMNNTIHNFLSSHTS